MPDIALNRLKNLLPFDGETYHFPCFVQGDYFQRLSANLQWQQGSISMFGKRHPEPRLSAWYGDSGKRYTYSGRSMDPLMWTPDLLILKEILSPVGMFNSCLANLYRHGGDSMGFHADNEKELGDQPVIASLSFGGVRKFVLRHRATKHLVALELADGDLLIMKGGTQKFWLHGIPKRSQAAPRINLTFRNIITDM